MTRSSEVLMAWMSVLLLAAASTSVFGQGRDYDPVTGDPPTVDVEHPATALETGFDGLLLGPERSPRCRCGR